MSWEFKPPALRGGTPEEQLRQLQSYLTQLTQQLNWALRQLKEK